LQDALAQLVAIPESQERVVLATGGYLGEGFDDARLDTLFLTLPVSWGGTIAQYAGRLHRLHDSKREVRIYDYADLCRCWRGCSTGAARATKRSVTPFCCRPARCPAGRPRCHCRSQRNGSAIMPPASDYAASVQRLLRDGVDAPLGELFVHAACTFEEGATGVERARSASEAFLYRRLQTLPDTAGKFHLNVELPIPFDGRGAMEVDLLSAEARVAIELDGPQHLADPAAYRRDRRKDALLQEHGYVVLRFLAEDVGKHLDDVLDTLLRTLARRQRDASPRHG